MVGISPMPTPALVSIAVLVAALAVSVLFVMRRPEPGRKPA